MRPPGRGRAILAAVLCLAAPSLHAGFAGIAGVETATTREGQTGLRIKELAPEGPAEKAGLRAGDILLAIDGVETGDPQVFARKIRETLAGQRVALRFLRDGQPREARVILTAPPAPPSGIAGQKAPPWTVARWHNLPEGQDSLDVSGLSGKIVYLLLFQYW